MRVRTDAGWAPHFLLLKEGGALAGAMPLYLKSHSYGEYVFDWGWADAYYRHGLEYYPKLLCAVPFTPVTGRRLLARDAASSASASSQRRSCSRASSTCRRCIVSFPLQRMRKRSPGAA